jgi:hypothetical protein
MSLKFYDFGYVTNYYELVRKQKHLNKIEQD